MEKLTKGLEVVWNQNLRWDLNQSDGAKPSVQLRQCEVLLFTFRSCLYGAFTSCDVTELKGLIVNAFCPCVTL